MPRALGDGGASAARVDRVKIVQKVVVAADLKLRHEDTAAGGTKPCVLLGFAERAWRLADRLPHELRMGIAVALDVPVRAVLRQHRTRDGKRACQHFALHRVSGWREPGAQPAFVLGPKRGHRLARHRNRIALHTEGHDVLAVVVDESPWRVRAVALAEEEEEVASVEIIPV